MSDRVIIIRIGELYLKGKNRNYFEKLLISNIKERLKGIECRYYFGRNRYIVSDFAVSDSETIAARLKTVFGLHSISHGFCTASEYSAILKVALTIVPAKGTFRVSANRADKAFPLNSVALCRELGGDILTANPDLTVDLHKPAFTLNVDVREDGRAYIFGEKILCGGGMPVGSAGRGLLLLSGGIDSPVAGYMMAKRGLSVTALHFHSYPYTSEQARDKVVELAKKLQDYCGRVKFYCIPLTQIQEEINRCCSNSYLITILRRFMMIISERVAKKTGCACLVNGESLGQVASQTLHSITVTNAVVNALPVLRPLIGMDKQEIIEIAIKIGTYETSILPFEDCCTVFLPENPVTKPTLERCEYEEGQIPDREQLIQKAIAAMEVIVI